MDERTFYVLDSRAQSINIAVYLVYRGNFNDARLIESRHIPLSQLVGKEPVWVDAYLGKGKKCKEVAFLRLIEDELHLVDREGKEYETLIYSLTLTDDFDEKYIISSEISLSTEG